MLPSPKPQSTQINHSKTLDSLTRLYAMHCIFPTYSCQSRKIHSACLVHWQANISAPDMAQVWSASPGKASLGGARSPHTARKICQSASRQAIRVFICVPHNNPMRITVLSFPQALLKCLLSLNRTASTGLTARQTSIWKLLALNSDSVCKPVAYQI